MKKNIFNPLIILSVTLLSGNLFAQDNSRGFKTTLDMTMTESGSTICEVTNKYTASYWDWWTKAVGSNTSIINNSLKKIFPKYHLTEFKHSQDPNERTNTVKFKIDGMMNINKNGKWEADLDKKDPNITKVSNKEWLLVDEGGETMKIHLPAGTNDSKVEKNSFGKAILTYSRTTGGGMGRILTYAGILIALAGVALLVRNLMAKKTTSASKSGHEKVTVHKETSPSISVPNEISNN